MSLSAWEQRNLDSIKDGLAGSDPGLATLLATFNRLASGEEMPTLEKVRASSREVTRCPGRKRRYPRWGTGDRVYQRLGLQWAALLLWLLITISLITVGLVLSRGGGQSACPRSWAVICVDSATAHTSHPAR
jgi:hypothetical protein